MVWYLHLQHTRGMKFQVSKIALLVETYNTQYVPMDLEHETARENAVIGGNSEPPRFVNPSRCYALQT